MHRREAISTLAGLGAVSLLHESSAQPLMRRPAPEQDQPIVVEGLIAGGLRLPHLRAQQAGGVHCGMASCPAEMNGWSRELKFLDTYRNEVVQARSVADIRKARADGRIAHVYGWQSAEGLGAAFNGAMGGVDTPLRAFHEIGLRSCGIAYNVANVFGGGCLEPATPLSRAGRRLVEELHKLRIVLDVGGHTGEQTSLDAIAMTRGIPVVCSHTNVAAIADNPRCISDRLIDAIAGTGGVIGLTAVNDFHVRGRRDAADKASPRVGVDKYIEQFEYIRKRVGVDHVGLGPDFVDGMPLNYDAVNREVITREMIGDGTWYYVKGFETGRPRRRTSWPRSRRGAGRSRTSTRSWVATGSGCGPRYGPEHAKRATDPASERRPGAETGKRRRAGVHAYGHSGQGSARLRRHRSDADED